MNVDTMRKLDYYAGVPLCFFGTVVRKVLLLFSSRRPAPPQNILFIELTEMGSAVLADPAMTKLKQRRGATLFFVIFSRNSASLELLNTVPRENIFRMNDTGIFAVALDAIRFIFWTRKNNIDTVIDLELFSRFTALLSGFSGASRTVGFHAFHNEGLYRGDFLTHKVAYNPHHHIAKNFISLVNALLADKPEVPYSKTVVTDGEIVLQRAVVSDDEKEAMRSRIREVHRAYDETADRIVLFNTNSSDLVPLRRWPREYGPTSARRRND